MTQSFMTAEEHFLALLGQSPDHVQDMFDTFRHTRVETGFPGRNFVIYEMDGRTPREIDRVIVDDFMCNEDDGATAEVTSLELRQRMVVDYSPRQLFTYPVLIWLPLRNKIRWGSSPTSFPRGSLGFDMTLKTSSRQHLRERGVVYCETGPSFGAEFAGDTDD